MKKPYSVLLFFLFLLPIGSEGQETFNKRMRFDLPAAALTSVVPTDSFYLGVAIFADSVPPYNTGTAFLKFDNEGELLDIKTIKSTEKTYEAWFGDLTASQNGGYVVSGYSIDTAMHALIIRYDEEGDTLYTAPFLNPYYPQEVSTIPKGGLVETEEGGFALLSSVSSVSSSIQFHFLKLDSMGNKQWDKIYGNSSWDRPQSLLYTPDGGYILGGLRTNQHITNMDYTYQCHIFKVDSLGNVEWDYLSPVSLGLRDAANDMVLLDDGSLVVASGIGHEQERTSVNVVYFEKMVFKLSTSGEIEWEVKYPDEDIDGYSKTTNLIKLTDGSGFVVAGMIHEALPPPTFYAVRGWLAKISDDGTKIWERQHVYLDDGEDEHSIYDIAESSDGGLIICGEAKEGESGATYRQQAWLLKLDQHGCLIPGCHLLDDVDEEIENPLQLAIYPNPTTDYLNFQLRSNDILKNGTFRIVNANRQVVEEFQVDVRTGDTFVLPVWDWSNGIYFLQYLNTQDGVIISQKFIKQ